MLVSEIEIRRLIQAEKALKARLTELEATELDDLGTLTHAARRLGVERSEHTLGSIIGLLEGRVEVLEREVQRMQDNFAMIAKVTDKSGKAGS